MSVDCLYSENIGLIHSVARKGYGRLQAIGASVDYDDVFQDMTLVFIKSAELWDSEKSKLSTYFTHAAYNELNRIAKRYEIERLELQIKSSEDLSQDEDFDIFEMVADNRITPDGEMELSMLVDSIVSQISPLAFLIVSWVVLPPKDVLREMQAKKAHAEYCRGIGLSRRARESDIGIVCNLLQLCGFTVNQLQSARLEIDRVVRRVLS